MISFFLINKTLYGVSKFQQKPSIASTVLITVQKHLFKLIPKFMFKYPKVLKI